MHIALLIGSENAGGSENQMRLLAKELLTAGHQVTVIFTDHHHCRFQRNPESALDFSGINNIKLSMRRFYRLFYKPYARLLIKLKKFDIAMACGPDNSYIMCELFKNSRTKLICRLSDLIFTDSSSGSDKNKTQIAISQVHAVVSNAQIALTEAENMQLLTAEKYQKVIRNAVICPDKINELQPDRFHVIFVGRLTKIKDPMTLLKALELAKKEIPHLTGEFVGYGVLSEEMQKYITEHNLADFIRLSGFIQQQHIPYSQADLLVNSSLSELSSGAIAEALYRGIPVVASDAGGNPELLENQTFGALFPIGNVEACAAEIIKFARKTPDERQQIARQAREFAEINFSPDNYVKNYIDIFKELSAQKPECTNAKSSKHQHVGTKVIHFTCMRSSKYGGLEHFFVKLAQASQQLGQKHIIVYNSTPASAQYIEDITSAGGEIAVIPRQGYVKDFFNFFRFIKQQRPSAVQTYFDFYAAFAAILAASVLKVRMRILSMHVLIKKSWKMNLFFKIFSWFITDAVSVSLGVKNNLDELAPCLAKRNQVLYLGIELNEADVAESDSVRHELNIPDDAIVIGNTAFSSPIKGIDILVKAFIKVAEQRKNVYLLQIGSTQNDEFIELLQKTGEQNIIDRAIFLGITDHIAKYLPATDIFVLSSRTEAMPLALMEAAAAGLPAIGSKVGGVPEAITENENGFTFAVEDVDTLAERMLQLIDDPELRKTFSENAKKLYQQKFCLTTQAEQYRDFYISNMTK